jgi:hypothetical protein
MKYYLLPILLMAAASSCYAGGDLCMVITNQTGAQEKIYYDLSVARVSKIKSTISGTVCNSPMSAASPDAVQFAEGDIVIIKEGVFSDYNGVVKKVYPDKLRAVVEILLLGRATPVDLEFRQIMLAGRSSGSKCGLVHGSITTGARALNVTFDNNLFGNGEPKQKTTLKFNDNSNTPAYDYEFGNGIMSVGGNKTRVSSDIIPCDP